jgi:hypothetical protein
MMKGDYFFLLLVFILFGLSACNFPTGDMPRVETQSPVVTSPVDAYPVDPLFQDFYTYLGGEPVLGPAISPAIPFGNIQSQYLESALMLFDPMAAPSERYTLAPLGVYLGISEEPVPDPGQPEARYANGHIIYEEFVPFYERLGGARFVGRPLTEARHNPAKLRIEQYFENLGFYRLEGDPPGKVRLIAYGAYSCDQRCRHQTAAASIPSLHGFLPGPFGKAASTLGLGFTGLTLSEPYRNEDGQMEVIFQNLVMVLEPEMVGSEAQAGFSIRLLLPAVFVDDQAAPTIVESGMAERVWVPLLLHVGLSSATETVTAEIESFEEVSQTAFEQVSFKAIAERLGIPRQPPGEKKDDPLLVFYPIGDGLGYNVPAYFDQFLQRYGGRAVSGDPIGEVFPSTGGVFRQCFANLCLDFNPNGAEGQQLRLAPLGVEYQARFHPSRGAGWATEDQSPVRLEVSEDPGFVTPAEGPRILAQTTRAGQPAAGQVLELTLTRPDNSQQTFSLPPTDAQGETSVLLPLIDAPNGTLAPYKVCLVNAEIEQTCVEDHYLIWDYP